MLSSLVDPHRYILQFGKGQHNPVNLNVILNHTLTAALNVQMEYHISPTVSQTACFGFHKPCPHSFCLTLTVCEACSVSQSSHSREPSSKALMRKYQGAGMSLKPYPYSRAVCLPAFP